MSLIVLHWLLSLYLKVIFLVHYYFQYMLMIYAIVTVGVYIYIDSLQNQAHI